MYDDHSRGRCRVGDWTVCVSDIRDDVPREILTMNAFDIVQIVVYLAALLLAVKPLGVYMARVYEGQPCGVDRLLGRLEQGAYRAAGVDIDSVPPLPK